MPFHTVKQGESLSKIADEYGFSDFHSIWDHPDNAELKQKRQNPNVLYPGDDVFIPEKELKEVSGATEQRHRFQCRVPKEILRIALEDSNGNPIANAPYELLIEEEIHRGTTDDKGRLEQRIPMDSQKGQLRLENGLTWDLLIGHLNPLGADTSDQGISGAQGRLLNLGYEVGKVDGIFGAKTEAALKQFQADGSLPVTGRLDEATRTKLIETHGC
jgi:hypothetical protein